MSAYSRWRCSPQPWRAAPSSALAHVARTRSYSCFGDGHLSRGCARIILQSLAALRSAVLNQIMVLDGGFLCANSGWSYALVCDEFERVRRVLLKKVTRWTTHAGVPRRTPERQRGAAVRRQAPVERPKADCRAPP